jgi:hypothetical protein
VTGSEGMWVSAVATKSRKVSQTYYLCVSEKYLNTIRIGSDFEVRLLVDLLFDKGS